MDPGLTLSTVVFATGLTVAGASILGVLPALKVTGRGVHGLRNLVVGGSTLRFGMFWTAAMIGQVALTIVFLPPAMGISEEALRDREIRDRFPAEEYLAVRVGLDRDAGPTGEEPQAAYVARFDKTYAELERRVMQEPDVSAVTLADGLPGMSPSVREAEVEVTLEAAPVGIANLWSASVGPQFFESCGIPSTAGRDFHAGDRRAEARTVIVNEAFARRYTDGASPLGRRVRYAPPNPATPEPWLEIVGIVRDIGMTPTDRSEAPYVFHAASVATASPLVMAVRVAGDPASLAPRLRAIATSLDPGLRLDEMQSLDDLAWKVELPGSVAAGAIVGVVSLGRFLSASGIFSLMSVSVARQTREMGLRTALGATRTRLLAGIFSRAIVLIAAESSPAISSSCCSCRSHRRLTLRTSARCCSRHRP